MVKVLLLWVLVKISFFKLWLLMNLDIKRMEFLKNDIVIIWIIFGCWIILCILIFVLRIGWMCLVFFKLIFFIVILVLVYFFLNIILKVFLFILFLVENLIFFFFIIGSEDLFLGGLDVLFFFLFFVFEEDIFVLFEKVCM